MSDIIRKFLNQKPYSFSLNNIERNVTKKPGIYGFTYKKYPIYIGMSDSLNRRMKEYFKINKYSRENPDLMEWIIDFRQKLTIKTLKLDSMAIHDIEELEELLIKTLNPHSNIRHNKYKLYN